MSSTAAPGRVALATRPLPPGPGAARRPPAEPGVTLVVVGGWDGGTDPGRPRRSVTRDGWETLTPRERQVVEHVTLGATNQQVARRLRVSPHTVSAHLRHVFDKLGVCSRVELTRIALAHEHDAQ